MIGSPKCQSLSQPATNCRRMSSCHVWCFAHAHVGPEMVPAQPVRSLSAAMVPCWVIL